MVRMFGEAIANEAFTKGMLLKKKTMELLAALRPVLGMDPMTGTPVVSLNVEATPSETNLRSIFGFLDKLQRDVYVAIDEFQQVAAYPESGTEALLRSFMQFSPNVHFIFAGSRQHLMTEMFASPERPFYQSTELMYLPPLEEEAYYQFAKRFFEIRQGGFDRQLFHDLYAAFDGYTWYIQTLLNRLYEHFRSVSKPEQLGNALSAVVESKSAYYESLMQFLTGNQFSLLRAIAKEERVAQPMGKKFVGKYRLPSGSSILAALRVLEEKELIYKQKDGYIVYDRFLNLWLKRL
ncbi:MAG: ATP-binding protein [Bacteroidales bacterium]|nr:ATP-binding protein [Bacteroidales bacterium]